MSTHSRLVIHVSRLPPATLHELNVARSLPLPAAVRSVLLGMPPTKPDRLQIQIASFGGLCQLTAVARGSTAR